MQYFPYRLFPYSETDAVHPRLSVNVPSENKNAFQQKKYQCYDCNLQFDHLNELVFHSRQNPLHCQEICLKCRDTILTFEQSSPYSITRLHTCKRSVISHQNSDLRVLSSLVSSKLCFSELTDYVIPCDSCNLSFPQTQSGFNEFLIHSNTALHNHMCSCRKCTLPQFVFQYETRNGVAKRMVHLCSTDAKFMLR